MNTKQILEKGIDCTLDKNYLGTKAEELRTFKEDKTYIEKLSMLRSAVQLTNLLSKKNRSFDAYDDEKLKKEIKSLKKTQIKAELLVNVVNNAIYTKQNMKSYFESTDINLRYGMDNDQLSVVIYNNMVKHGVKKGFQMLNNYSVLFGVCELFVRNKQQNKMSMLDKISITDNLAISMNSQIDEYCANELERKSNVKQKTLTNK